MTTGEAKDLLVRLVTEMQGCKVMELVARPELYFENPRLDWSDLIEVCVTEGRIIEVEYVLPEGGGAGKIKSFLLPANTYINIEGAHQHT